DVLARDAISERRRVRRDRAARGDARRVLGAVSESGRGTEIVGADGAACLAERGDELHPVGGERSRIERLVTSRRRLPDASGLRCWHAGESGAHAFLQTTKVLGLEFRPRLLNRVRALQKRFDTRSVRPETLAAAIGERRAFGVAAVDQSVAIVVDAIV